ncbi:MAG TPA: hypothetical protein VD928_00745 [Candidatus Paceibacterota bacterium]|nr:hypothetical protein [Candidatus Paceibacterota bacterium]
MKRYIERLKEEKTTHERRQFAMKAATVFTAVIFVGWIATLGVRFAETAPSYIDSNTAATLTAIEQATTTWFGN